jgi:hypothetical protein
MMAEQWKRANPAPTGAAAHSDKSEHRSAHLGDHLAEAATLEVFNFHVRGKLKRATYVTRRDPDLAD